jgi:predicted nucleic-acid-binding protein
MLKVFLDTNVYLRFFIIEEEKAHQECVRLIGASEEGVFRPYTSGFVLSEIGYVLEKIYKESKNSVVEKLNTIARMRNMTFAEKGNTLKAIEYFEKLNVKLGDCFIATQVPDGVTFVTYDNKHFVKFKGLKVMTPRKFLLELDSKK